MFEGGCLCGEVTYAIDGGVSSVWLCHCSKCRKTTGSAFAAVALCRAEDFRWRSGEDAITHYVSPTGYPSSFCRVCGCNVPLVRADEGRAIVLPGSLDGDFEKGVSHHIFVGSKADWFEIADDCDQFQEHVPPPPGTGA